MRSRYSAYALGLADYIMATTHPKNPTYITNHKKWRKEILAFSNNTQFVGLDILQFVDGKEEALVAFTAHLKQQNQEASFTEESRFEKVHGRWLYLHGIKKPC
jgi:SEC-C motif-containing protein